MRAIKEQALGFTKLLVAKLNIDRLWCYKLLLDHWYGGYQGFRLKRYLDDLFSVLEHIWQNLEQAMIIFFSLNSEFGGKVFSLKPIVKVLPKLFDHNDKMVREEVSQLSLVSFRQDKVYFTDYTSTGFKVHFYLFRVKSGP